MTMIESFYAQFLWALPFLNNFQKVYCMVVLVRNLSIIFLVMFTLTTPVASRLPWTSTGCTIAFLWKGAMFLTTLDVPVWSPKADTAVTLRVTARSVDATFMVMNVCVNARTDGWRSFFFCATTDAFGSERASQPWCVLPDSGTEMIRRLFCLHSSGKIPSVLYPTVCLSVFQWRRSKTW